jgi:hypothetical protein
MNDETARESWQASVTEATLPSIDQVRAGADKFYRRLRLRNIVEYVACVIVVVSFGIYTFTLEHVLQRIGSAMVVVGTLVAAWQLNRRASAVPPEQAGEMPIMDFVRAQLVRQRDALASIFWWYLLPFIPGMVVMSTGSVMLRPPEGAAQTVGAAIAGLVLVGTFAGIWWLNLHWARKLQKHIDEIDALTRQDPSS